MKISNSIPALLFLTGMMCLFFSSCNDDESERGTLIPLRLSMTIPAAEGSVTTRAAGNMGSFKMALSTTAGQYDGAAKDYEANGSEVSATLTPKVSTEELKISRLATKTPLTLYGTYKHSTLGNQPMFYSADNTPCTEGAISIQPQLGNAIIVVNSGNKERYQVNIKSLYSPTISNNQYTWNTTGKIPTLESSGANPAAFETTSTITKPSDLADGYYASVVPGRVAEGNIIMSITELNGAKQGDTYQVTTPSAITFEANKCYFITLNVNAEKEVTMTVEITPMTTETIKLRTGPGIYDLQDLKDFRDAWNSKLEEGIGDGTYNKWLKKEGYTYTVNLYADIDLNKEEWVPINDLSSITFEGNDHTLSNLKQTSQEYFGLFTVIGPKAEVKNLTIDGASMEGVDNIVQVFASAMTYSLISNCHVKNATLIGAQVYGFVGSVATNCKIEGCSISYSSLEATNTTAGITSEMFDMNGSEITACSVSDCEINGPSGNSSIAYPQGGITITACIASDIQLGSNQYNAIADGAVNGCYYANVTAGGTEIKDEEGYLVTPADLETNYVNNQLNNTLYTKSSFPFKFKGGKIVKGSPSNTASFPKGIYTATHLADCGKNPGNYAENNIINLYDDIDMQDVSYTPMGSSSSPADYSFKGNNHKISNLNAAGLYGEACVNKSISIENLIMVNPTFFSSTTNSGLVASGLNEPLTFTNCQILGGSSNAIADGEGAGGLVGGCATELIINNCLVSGMSQIEAPYAGGFMGISTRKVTISRSAVRNIGLLKGGYIGSFVGYEMGSGSEYKSCIAEKIKGEASYYFGFAVGSHSNNMTLTGILYYNVPNATDGESTSGSILTKNKCEKVDYGFGFNHATILNDADPGANWFYDYNKFLITQENWEQGY